MDVRINVNGTERVVDISGPDSLLTVLRRDLDLLGTKDACEQGECGSCSVVMDDEVVCSCLVMAADAEGAKVTTVEGLSEEGELNPVQEALLAAGAVQCGFCTPGFVVAATHLLEGNPHPTGLEIREALSGNICRCTGYGSILRALDQLTGDAT
ncbi:MAG: (2Fe-2S)-binding protein [Acidimicrobiia bacterium]|jgi:aerobic carbon-monoxide dehydrogenase small subunit